MRKRIPIKGKFVASIYPTCFYSELRDKILTAKIDKKHKWIYLYHNKKLLWDCNYIFFKTNFFKVNG
jgi:hypothetical protein